MKLTAFLLLTVLVYAYTPVMSQRVNISGNNLSLEQVFREIKKQTGIEFFYESSLLKKARPVTLDVKNMLVDDVLMRCVEGQGLGFSIRGNTIVIFEDVQSAISKDTALPVRGRVVDVQGLPVAMASVILARTRAGIQTDRAGAFTLKIKKVLPGDSLLISFTGYKTQSVQLGRETDLGLIVLQVADNVLDQAVVTAYGTTTEKFRTGDITTVKAVDIERTPTLNVLEALSGRVPGLYVRQKGGNPGSVYDIQLRGVNVMPPTINMALVGEAKEILSKPLIVLDGLPLPPDVLDVSGMNAGVETITGMIGAAGGQDILYWLNPLDVENLTVLKDAEATSLYGSRAANGVIIITTKKGKPGKASLNITFNTGVNTNARRLKLMNTQQYLAMRREGWSNTMRAGLYVIDGSGTPTYAPQSGNSNDLLLWDTIRYTDWQRELLGSAPVYNGYLALSGGEGRTNYRLSAGHNRFNSSYPHRGKDKPFRDEKSTLSLTVTTRSLNNRLQWTVSVTGATTTSYQPGLNPDNFIFLAPNAPAAFDEAGNLNFAEWRRPGIFSGFITYNSLFILASRYQSNRFSMLSRTTISYEIFRSLVFSIGAGYSRSDGKQVMTLPGAAYDPIQTNIIRQSLFGNSNSSGLNVEPNLRYDMRKGRHAMSVLAGASYQSDEQEGRIVVGTGYTSDALMGTPDNASDVMTGTNMLQRKSVSALARVSYRYADEWLIDLSGRRDGSSSFGPGRRYGNFGSVGWGWIFTRQAWSRAIPLLTFGKIRGSYGVTGNQSANPYSYLSTFTASRVTPTSSGVYQGIPTFTLTRIANPAFGWAQASTLELGIDLYLLKEQRLKLTIQWYRKVTGNQLLNTPVSSVTGTTEYFANLPVKLENKGLELMIDYSPLQRHSAWQWYAHLNIAANKNKLLSFPGLENSLFKNYYKIGLPLAWQQVYPTGVDTATGTYKRIPGADSYQVGNYPVLTGGLQAGISYKRLLLSVSFTFAKQKGWTNVQGTLYPGVLDFLSNSNQPVSVMKDRHWQTAADSTIGGAIHASDAFSHDLLDRYWGDASYLAIKNATLNYDLPLPWLKKARLSNVSVYARAENLLLLPLSDYTGMNPEQPGLQTQLPLRMVFVSGFTINL
jgi:TonB-linked SusC/RagA family outer membrane protein